MIFAAVAFFNPGILQGQINYSIAQFTDETSGDYGPGDLSTDSIWLAYSGDTNGARGSGNDVYRANLLTGTVENVTESFGNSGAPTISADGTRIAFGSASNATGGNPDGNLEIFLADLSKDQFLQLTDSTGGNNFIPAISDAGDRVFFLSRNDLVGENPAQTDQVFLYDVGQASLSQVTHLTSSFLRGFTTNPSGSLLAISTGDDLTGDNPEGNYEIFVIELGTASVTQISETTTGINGAPRISADGQRIAFLSDSEDLLGSNPEGSTEAVLYDQSSGTFTQLTDLDPTSADVAITANGNRVFMNFNDTLIIHEVATGDQETLVLAPGILSLGATNPDGSLVTLRSDGDLTGGNPDQSFELFLVKCPGIPIFTDGFESEDVGSWSASFGT